MATSVDSTVATLDSTLEAVSLRTFLHAADIGHEAALDFAGARLRPKAQRHPLQMRVELVAQIAHQLLPDQQRQIAVAQRKQGGEERRAQREKGVVRDDAEVLFEQPIVDERLKIERRQQTDHRRTQHKGEDAQQMRLVGAEQAHDAAHGGGMRRFFGNGTVGRWHGREFEGESPHAARLGLAICPHPAFGHPLPQAVEGRTEGDELDCD